MSRYETSKNKGVVPASQVFNPDLTFEQNVWNLILARKISPGNDNAEIWASKDMQTEYERLFQTEILQDYLDSDSTKNEIIDFISLYAKSLNSGAGDRTHPNHPEFHSPVAMPPETEFIVKATSSNQLGKDEIDLGTWATKHPLFKVTPLLEKDGVVYRVFEQLPSSNSTPGNSPTLVLAILYSQDKDGEMIPTSVVKLSNLK
ncbi:hypothetical protein KBC85_01890 [Candidatus Saccharibacteria bacterium]|nr:hypothetical protein [Candidatus Saccharibacteria bacterium]MDQ5885595.1 hypothetical protein [Patescibacteria group bacterium]MDQ5953662.1 hypothetical protein [Patescibacteria group bacterium]MDQ5958715.1 hypothetical protein [Patescibacteria group bacterium]